MDAKAKAVAYQWQASGGVWLLCTEETVHEYSRFFPVRALVLESDHEAALAELERIAVVRLRSQEKAVERAAIAITAYETLLEQHNVLLAGLEALAGEWERVVMMVGGHDTPHTDAAILTCVKELRTLTNSANSENHEVLKS